MGEAGAGLQNQEQEAQQQVDSQAKEVGNREVKTSVEVD
jgi:hypothetical protein